MSEEKKNDEYGLKTPPPKEYETARGREFLFGKPALRHRMIVSKVMKFIAKPAANYGGIIKCAKKRKMTVEEFLKLDETKLTKDELKEVMKGTDNDKNAEFAGEMMDILVDVLLATIKKRDGEKIVPRFDNHDDLETVMDDLGESIELFPIALKWVQLAIADIGNINRKN
ncbi:MAG: hypothetical protein ACTSSE_08480 [Candidatus Thorarchaeota archaeon]